MADIKRKYTLKFDTPDERDYPLNLTIEKHKPKVDLRSQMPPVFNQGRLGSCTANALCGMRQFFAMKHGDTTALSRLYLYWHEREIEGTINEDSGAMLRDGMKVLKKLGCCPEDDFPYDIRRFAEKPSARAEADAPKYRIKSYHRVRSLHELKTCLNHGLPVAIGIKVYESFESREVAETGIVPVPNVEFEEFLGGHAVLCVGYEDENEWLIVRNSWGEEWGDRGYCYIPYEFAHAGLIVDAWVANVE